jgi:hypothetical protein
LSKKVLGCAIEVHKHLGPGLLESTYQNCLAFELTQQDIPFRKEVELPVQYKGVSLECGYRLDLLVEENLIVELKSVEELVPIHTAQLLTYMKLSGISTGLLLNFNVTKLKDGGIKRYVL